MKIHLFLLAGALSWSLTACDSGDENKGGDAKAAAPKTVYACKITVAAKAGPPETFKGQAQTADEKEAEDKAWEDVCSKLPEADTASCRDNDKFKWALGGMSTEVDGVTQYSKTITLTRAVKAEEFDGEHESEESSEAACTEALALACKAAGAEGDCVEAGSHEQRGRRESKETK
jgi:hypothetical protein